MLDRRTFACAVAAFSAGCSSWVVPDRIVIGEAEIASRLAERFPQSRRLADGLELRADVPRVTLLPDRNRVGLDVGLEVGERAIEGRQALHVPVRIALDSALRLDEAAGTVALADVQVQRVRLEAAPRLMQALLEPALRSLVRESVEGAVIHRFTARQLERVHAAGRRPGPLRVTPEGIELPLLPLP